MDGRETQNMKPIGDVRDKRLSWRRLRPPLEKTAQKKKTKIREGDRYDKNMQPKVSCCDQFYNDYGFELHSAACFENWQRPNHKKT